MISFMEKKLEHKYKELNKLINEAIGEKDMDAYEEYTAFKLGMDVHVFGKGTLDLYRSLLSFTNCLLLCTGSKLQMQGDSFAGLMTFLEKAAESP
jgi:hypothetical protein